MGKRKIIVGILTAALAFGAVGTGALADELPTKESIQKMFENGIPSFSDMLPFMKKMHPTMSDKQLEDMYQSCHGKDGMMQNMDKMPQHSNMMNHF